MDDYACSDGELVAWILGGRRQVFATLMKRHKEPIYRLILGYVGNADDALDLVQESFVAAYRSLERYDDRRPSAPGWPASPSTNLGTGGGSGPSGSSSLGRSRWTVPGAFPIRRQHRMQKWKRMSA